MDTVQVRCEQIPLMTDSGRDLDGAQCVEGSRSITEMLRRSCARHRATYCGGVSSAMCHGLDFVT